MIFGRNEFAVRLQAAVASVGQVTITEALAEDMFGATTGIFAALALALSPLFFTFARAATPDPALAFFMTAAMACFYKGAQSAGPTAIDGKWMVVAAVMLGLGTLTKGPVALALGGAIALLWLLLEGRRRDLLQLPWFRCVTLYLGLTVPWFIVVGLQNRGFFHFFIIHEHFERYLESTEHGWGFWFYVPITIAGTWPWFYFAPLGLTGLGDTAAFGWAFIKKSSPAPSDFIDSARRERAAMHFLITWFAVVLVFFSIPRSKLGEYVLPALPPIGILAGRGVARIEKINVSQRRRLFLIFALLNLAAAIAIMVALLATRATGLRPALARDATIAAAALLAGGTAPLFFYRDRWGAVSMGLAISMIILMGAGLDARSRVAPWISYRRLARLIVPYTNRGCRLMSYRHFEQALPFYTGVRETLVNYRGELEPFGPQQDLKGTVFADTAQLQKVWAGGQCILLVVNRLDLPTLLNLLYPKPITIGCEGKKMALSNSRLDNWPTLEDRIGAACYDP